MSTGSRLPALFGNRFATIKRRISTCKLLIYSSENPYHKTADQKKSILSLLLSWHIYRPNLARTHPSFSNQRVSHWNAGGKHLYRSLRRMAVVAGNDACPCNSRLSHTADYIPCPLTWRNKQYHISLFVYFCWAKNWEIQVDFEKSSWKRFLFHSRRRRQPAVYI